MKISAQSDIGYRRSENQDKYLAGKISEDKFFGFVCDGMGGANGGSIASDIITKNLEEFIYMNENSSSFNDEEIILNAIDKANTQIFTLAKNNPDYKGMGTTLSGFTLINDKCRVYNVGDSRTYIFRNKKLTQISEDHSVAYELYKQGALTFEEIASYPQKNLITRAIGVEEEVEVDMYTLDLEKGDIILTVSDGLYNFVTNENISSLILENKNSLSLPQAFINLALLNNASDNVTVVVAHYQQ